MQNQNQTTQTTIKRDASRDRYGPGEPRYVLSWDCALLVLVSFWAGVALGACWMLATGGH